MGGNAECAFNVKGTTANILPPGLTPSASGLI